MHVEEERIKKLLKEQKDDLEELNAVLEEYTTKERKSDRDDMKSAVKGLDDSLDEE